MLLDYQAAPPAIASATPPKPQSRSKLMLLGGVLLPAFALAIDRLLGALLDPMNLPWLTLASFLVPVLHLALWRRPDAPWAPVLPGFTLVIAGYFAAIFLPILPLVLIISVFVIGLPMLAPFTACAAAIAALLRCRNAPAFATRAIAGAAVALLALVVTELPAWFAREAVSAVSGHSYWVSMPGAGSALARLCNGRQTPLELWAWRGHSGRDACALSYLATGAERDPQPQGRWDWFRGQTETGPRIAALHLAASEINGEIDGVAGTQSIDWILEFRNDGEAQQEARLRVALPPQGVVRQVSLWVNGEERQAAFGGSEQVRAAYQKVAMVQRRDPLLVTWAGRDEIYVQAFPVQPKSRMRIRLGIVAPLGDRFVPPRIVEQNMDGRAHRLKLSGDDGVTARRALVRPVRDPLDSAWMIAAHRLPPAPLPSPVTVVIDGSVWMQPHAEAASRDLLELVNKTHGRVLVAGETPVEVSSLAGARFAAGADNVPALLRAVRETPQGGAVIWMHGPQPHLYESTAELERELERGVPLYGYRVQAGANQVWNAIGRLPGVRPLQDLSELHRRDWTWLRLPATAEAIDRPDGAALWAAGEDAAMAKRYRVVTRKVGAVVLERDEQYHENGLTPPPSTDAAPTPEPATWILVLTGAVLAVKLRKKFLLAS